MYSNMVVALFYFILDWRMEKVRQEQKSSRAKRLAKLKRSRGPLREWFADPLERQLLNLLLIRETTYCGIVSVKISYYILLYVSAVKFCNLSMFLDGIICCMTYPTKKQHMYFRESKQINILFYVDYPLVHEKNVIKQ